MSLLGENDTVLWQTYPPKQLGESFEVPINPDARIRISDFAAPESGGLPRRLDEVQLPLENWREEDIRFPQSGTVLMVRFDTEDQDKAPLFKELPPVAERELEAASPTPRDR
jgi:hypothetical protein